VEGAKNEPNDASRGTVQHPVLTLSDTVTLTATLCVMVMKELWDNVAVIYHRYTIFLVIHGCVVYLIQDNIFGISLDICHIWIGIEPIKL